MAEQNVKNHARLVPLHHFLLLPLIIAINVAAFYKLYQNYTTGLGGGLLIPIILCGIGLALLMITLLARKFVLKVQDRAIRAEENLRYYAISGKLLDSRLTLQQIIALRFAPNNELLDLSHRAVAENLSASQIKHAIKNWRADHDRA